MLRVGFGVGRPVPRITGQLEAESGSAPSPTLRPAVSRERRCPCPREASPGPALRASPGGPHGALESPVLLCYCREKGTTVVASLQRARARPAEEKLEPAWAPPHRQQHLWLLRSANSSLGTGLRVTAPPGASAFFQRRRPSGSGRGQSELSTLNSNYTCRCRQLLEAGRAPALCQVAGWFYKVLIPGTTQPRLESRNSGPWV